MKVEVWFDFTCPFCYIGKKYLDRALEKFDKSQFVKIEFKSYQQDPNANSETNDTIYTIWMKKYDLSIEEVKERTKLAYEQGSKVGLTFHLDNVKHTNTFDAHRLVKYAEKHGKANPLIERIYDYYFNRNNNIGCKDTLLTIAKEVGLNEMEVDELLSLNNYAKAVNIDEDIAKEIGIDGVPFFIFNEKHALSGVQPIDVLLDALDSVWIEDGERLMQKKAPGNQCVSSFCVGEECESDSEI